MSLVRDLPLTVSALPETLVATCSDLLSTAASTAGSLQPIRDTTADAIITTCAESTAFGRVIDRLRQPIGAMYKVGVASAWVTSTRGSTEADRKITVGARIQHGDSSGGGDMADLSTSTGATRQFFSTARSTDHASWDGGESTGPFYGVSNPAYFDLTAAKRYVRLVVPVLKNKVTTESSGDEQCRVGGSITFMAGDKVPQRLDTTGPFSSSTTT